MENKKEEETNKKTQNNSNAADAIGAILFVIIAIAVMIIASYFMK